MYGTLARSADRLADRLLSWADLPDEPTVDVHELAARVGVLVQEAQMIESGRLVPQSGGRAIVLLNKDEPWERRRYTLAHELAHWALIRPDIGGEPARDAQALFVSEEALCDFTSGSLLLPQRWILANVRADGAGLRAVRDVARRCDVSLSAALVRLRELFNWPHSLLLWRYNQGRWDLDGEAGVSRRQLGSARTTKATLFTLAQLRAQGPGTRTCDIPLRFQDCEHVVRAEVLVRNTSIVAMAKLPGP